jgi:hypothetical protein
MVGTARFELPKVRLRLTPLADDMRHSLARMRVGVLRGSAVLSCLREADSLR